MIKVLILSYVRLLNKRLVTMDNTKLINIPCGFLQPLFSLKSNLTSLIIMIQSLTHCYFSCFYHFILSMNIKQEKLLRKGPLLSYNVVICHVILKPWLLVQYLFKPIDTILNTIHNYCFICLLKLKATLLIYYNLKMYHCNSLTATTLQSCYSRQG